MASGTPKANMKIAVLSITEGGKRLARLIASRLDNAHILDCKAGVSEVITRAWRKYNGFVLVMATGIVVRAVAKLIEDKRTDPCVVVCDEKGRFAISLLSGHLGGGNDLARKISAITGGEAVITTSSDTLGLPALDLWARDKGLIPENPKDIIRLSSLLVNKGFLRIFPEIELRELPNGFIQVEDVSEADIVISPSTCWRDVNAHFMRPRILVVGIGCNRGVTSSQIEEAVTDAFIKNNLSVFSIHSLATIDLKKDEKGLSDFAREKGLELNFFSKDELNAVPSLNHSEPVFRATGAYGVSEPAAILASKYGRLIVKKIKYKDVTIAVARKNDCE